MAPKSARRQASRPKPSPCKSGGEDDAASGRAPGPAVSPQSDEELARRAQQGCRVSLDELLRRYQVPVLHFLRRRGSAADAEDLLQETFVRVYKNIARYRAPWRFAPWVFTIARHISINHHRRWQPATDDGAIRTVASAESGPEDLAQRNDDRRYLWARAAAVLSEEEQAAMWLHYVEEMPVREIAGVLGRPWVSVKVMMFRARRRLLPLVQELEPEGRSRPSAGQSSEVCHE